MNISFYEDQKQAGLNMNISFSEDQKIQALGFWFHFPVFSTVLQ